MVTLQDTPDYILINRGILEKGPWNSPDDSELTSCSTNVTPFRSCGSETTLCAPTPSLRRGLRAFFRPLDMITERAREIEKQLITDEMSAHHANQGPVTVITNHEVTELLVRITTSSS